MRGHGRATDAPPTAPRTPGARQERACRRRREPGRAGSPDTLSSVETPEHQQPSSIGARAAANRLWQRASLSIIYQELISGGKLPGVYTSTRLLKNPFRLLSRKIVNQR